MPVRSCSCTDIVFGGILLADLLWELTELTQPPSRIIWGGEATGGEPRGEPSQAFQKVGAYAIKLL